MVMIVGQDRILVEALQAWLGTRADMRVIPACPPDHKVDVVLIDTSLRREEALAATLRVSEDLPGAKAVVFGLEGEDEGVVDFVEAGALGYVVKGTPARDLAQIIRDVHAGKTRCSPRIASSIVVRIGQLAERREPPRETAPEPLTPREVEILRAIAEGLANKEIGKRLRISVSTVKNHVHNILEKLGVGQRREAVKLAYRLGLLAEEPDRRPPGGLIDR
jgi:DNA-binding NarL/FixJ family response regulator